MMHTLEYHVPTRFRFGRNAEYEIGETLFAWGARRVLLHFGEGTSEKSGLLERVRLSLQDSGIACSLLGAVRPNPEVTLVREGVKLCREEKIDWICAVGGGSVIDSAKAIALAVGHDGDIWDFYEKHLPAKKVLPLAVVPTTSASGSEASGSSVLSNDGEAVKSEYRHSELYPRIAFMNPELTFTLPAHQTAAGLVSMYCHALECLFGTRNPVTLRDNLCFALLKTVITEGTQVLKNPDNFDARADIMWTALLCQQGVACLGNKRDSSVRALVHELVALDARIAYGVGLSVIFPAWMRAVLSGGPERFAIYGKEVFGLSLTGDATTDALRAIEKTEQLFASWGMQATRAELSLTSEHIALMAKKLRRNAGVVFGTFAQLGPQDARNIYRSVL